MSAAVGEARAATDLWMCNYDMHNNHFIDFPILIREALVQHSVSFADDVRCGAKGGARLDEAVKCTRIGTHRKRRGFAIVGRQASATQYSSPKSPKMPKFGPGEAEINKNPQK